MLAMTVALGACGDDEPSGASGGDLVARGQTLFEENCARCHGIDLKGTETGPPFLSPIYAPNHHPDEAFHAAIAQGVQPHHWDFGPMPSIPALGTEEAEAILAYVRAEQEDAGITEDPSHP